MEKSYYDILQVNKNASPEIIEKAYKVLAKKYHPDLQEEANKKQAEEILKEINEAYEILSDPEKRRSYDNLLEAQKKPEEPKQNTEISREELLRRQNEQQGQREEYKQQLQKEQDLAYQEQLLQARQKAYYDAYIQDLKNRGYKIRYKKTFKDYIKGFISIVITLFILFLIWQIPFVKQYFKDLYIENSLFKLIIDLITGLFT